MVARAWVLAADVCPTAPPGVQTYADQVLGWVKWGVVVILGISFFASVGMLVWGRVTHHPRGARLGFDGLMVCLLGAIIYVAGYAIIASIIGSGCGASPNAGTRIHHAGTSPAGVSRAAS